MTLLFLGGRQHGLANLFRAFSNGLMQCFSNYIRQIIIGRLGVISALWQQPVAEPPHRQNYTFPIFLTFSRSSAGIWEGGARDGRGVDPAEGATEGYWGQVCDDGVYDYEPALALMFILR